MIKLEINDSQPEYIKCPICDAECDKREGICDWCWYGMRMSPEEWKAELKSRGIEVERSVGCQQLSNGVLICGNPYKSRS